MGKKHGIVLSTICLALLLSVSIPENAFATVYNVDLAKDTATARFPTVELGTSLALDGHNVSLTSCTTPCSLSISTTLANDLIVILTEGNSVNANTCSVSDVQGLTWSTRYACQAVPPGNPTTRAYGVYWAVATTPLTKDSITVTDTGGNNFRLLAFAVNGANTNYPFDPNINIPSFTSANSPSGCVMTTTNANDFLFSTAQQGGLPSYTVPGGFTPIDHTSYGEESEDAYGIVTTAQSGVTETWTGTAGSNIVTTCDAIVAAGNIGSSSNSLNTAVSVTIVSPITGSGGSSYYENANGPVPCSVTTDTSTTAPGTSGSFTFTSIQNTCLVTPVFASTTSIQAGAWLADLWVSSTATAAISLALKVVTATGTTVTAVSTASISGITTSKTEIKTYLSAYTLVVPSGDYIELLITPLTATVTYTLYWGSGQLTSLQQPNTYGVLLSIINPSNTISYLIDLGYVSSSNSKIGNMTIFIAPPTSRQIIIGSSIGSPTPPNTFGPQVTLSPSQTMFIGLGVLKPSVGSTLVTITLKIQLVVAGSTATPYAQDTVFITVS